MASIVMKVAGRQVLKQYQKTKIVLAAALCVSPIVSHSAEFTEHQQKQVIENTLQLLQHSIYSKEQIAQLARVLRTNLVEFNYAGYEDKNFFSQKLSKDIAKKLGSDAVTINIATSSDAPNTSVNALTVQYGQGDVAIVDLDLNATNQAIDKMFKDIEKSDALIFDLRGNDGGNLNAMRYLSGYLFNAKVPLAVFRNSNQETVSTVESDPKIAGKPRPELPLFILTNTTTSGVAESFALAMQQQRLAYVVGENTAGEVNLKKTNTVFSGIEVSYPVSTVIEPKSQFAIEGIGITPDLPVVSILSLKQAHELAKVSAVKYRVAQDRATPEEQYSLYRENIEYGQWQYAKGKCLVSYRVAEPRFNQSTEKYQFPYQVKFYGNGKSKVSYELGNGSGKMNQTVHFIDREDVKSGISIGFSSHLPLTIKRCKTL